MQQIFSSSVFTVTLGGAWSCVRLELCDSLADDFLLPRDKGEVLLHVATTMLGRKSGWLLEAANVDNFSLMVKYSDGKNCYISQSPNQPNAPTHETAMIAHPQTKILIGYEYNT